MLKKWSAYSLPALAILAACIGYPYLRFSFFSADMTSSPGNIQVIAHRGASDAAPENTLAAFRLALSDADALELDVHLTADELVVVMHDATVDRTTTGTGALAEMTYATVATLDAGSWFGPAFANERVPTLDQVLDLVDGERTVLVELKWPQQGIYTNLVARVVDIIRKHKAESWVIVQSFEYEYLRELHTLAPDITFYQLVYGYRSFPPVYRDRTLHLGRFPAIEGASGLAIYYKFLSPQVIKKYHAMGRKVVTWTVNDPGDIRRVANLGVDGIISDNPGVVRMELGTSRP